ncbi:hypothetical protein BDZ45DRAFT_63031 [Acephala macrosclerotiorum]|nr:hypothetical protein BDZ45DRAFT_63031 [Acephala macrosclerotiorum]
MFPITQPLIVYVLDSNKCRQFSSPGCAGLTSLWRVYHNLRYRHFLAVYRAHQKLGTHVWIALNHISISDLAAVNDIYGYGANMLKDAWCDGGVGKYRHMADSRVKAEYQGKRKMFAHVFDQKTITNLEPVFAKQTATLVQIIDGASDNKEKINIRRYLNYFAIDLISTLLHRECLGCINTILGFEA